MIIVTLEWNSLSGEVPIVLVTDDGPSARRAALEEIRKHLPVAANLPVPPHTSGDGEIGDIDRTWVQGHPVPDDPTDDEAVTAWLAEFWEATTDLRVTLYGKSAEADLAFQDLRQAP